MVPLMERYPEVPGFVKFKSRFLMERARNGIDMVEAELYIDEALRLFPEVPGRTALDEGQMCGCS